MRFTVPLMSKVDALSPSTRQFTAVLTKINKDTNSLNVAEVELNNVLARMQYPDVKNNTIHSVPNSSTHTNVPIKILTDVAYFKFKQSGLDVKTWLADGNNPYEDAWTIFLAFGATELYSNLHYISAQDSLVQLFLGSGIHDAYEHNGLGLPIFVDCLETPSGTFVTGVHQNWWSSLFAHFGALDTSINTYIGNKFPFYASGRVMPTFDLFVVFYLYANSSLETYDSDSDLYWYFNQVYVRHSSEKYAVLFRLKDKQVFPPTGYIKELELGDLLEGSFVVSQWPNMYASYNNTSITYAKKCNYPPTGFPSAWTYSGPTFAQASVSSTYLNLDAQTRNGTLYHIFGYDKMGGEPYGDGLKGCLGSIIPGLVSTDWDRSAFISDNAQSWTYYYDSTIDVVVNVEHVSASDEKIMPPGLQQRVIQQASIKVLIKDEQSPTGSDYGLNAALDAACRQALIDKGGAGNTHVYPGVWPTVILAKPRFRRGSYFGEEFDYGDSFL